MEFFLFQKLTWGSWGSHSANFWTGGGVCRMVSVPYNNTNQEWLESVHGGFYYFEVFFRDNFGYHIKNSDCLIFRQHLRSLIEAFGWLRVHLSSITLFSSTKRQKYNHFIDLVCNRFWRLFTTGKKPCRQKWCIFEWLMMEKKPGTIIFYRKQSFCFW